MIENPPLRVLRDLKEFCDSLHLKIEGIKNAFRQAENITKELMKNDF